MNTILLFLVCCFNVLQAADEPEIFRNKPEEQKEIFKKFEQKVDDLVRKHDSLENFKTELDSYYNNYAVRHPGFLLHECDNRFCALSRVANPKVRPFFEKMVSRKLLTIPSEKEIQYTSFGSGELLPDLRILYGFLQQRPHAKISIHSIDEKNRLWTLYRTYCQKDSTICAQDEITADDMNDTLHNKLKENIQITNENSDLKKNLLLDCMIQEKMSLQFLGLLKLWFPQAQFNLTLHSDVTEYYNYAKARNNWPDLLMALDITDDESNNLAARDHYTSLCHAFLKINPKLENYWLLYTSEGFANISFSLVKNRLQQHISQLPL